MLEVGGAQITLSVKSDVAAKAAEASAAVGGFGKAADAAKGQAAAYGARLQDVGRAATIATTSTRAFSAALSGDAGGALAYAGPLLMQTSAGIKAMGAAMLAFITGPIALIAGAAAAIYGLAKAYSALKTAQDEVAASAASLAGQTAKNNAALYAKSMESATTESTRLADQYAATGVATAEMAAHVGKLASAFGGGSGPVREFMLALNPAESTLKRLGVATDNEISQLHRARSQWDQMRGSVLLSEAAWKRGADALDSQMNAALGRTVTKAAAVKSALDEVLSLADLAAGAGSAVSDFETADTGLQSALDPYAGRDAERAAQSEAAEQAARDGRNEARARDNQLNAILLAEREEIEKASADRIAATWTDLTSGMSSAWAGLWEDLASGTENAGGRFLGAILRIIGQLAIQWGTYFMLQGAAMMFSPGMQGLGVGLIAGGLALSAMGGAVMGVGAKMAGGSTAGAGGGSQRGPTTSAIESQTGVRRQGEQGGGTVVVNVYSGQALATQDDVAVAVHTGMRRAQAMGFS